MLQQKRSAGLYHLSHNIIFLYSISKYSKQQVTGESISISTCSNDIYWVFEKFWAADMTGRAMNTLTLQNSSNQDVKILNQIQDMKSHLLDASRSALDQIKFFQTVQTHLLILLFPPINRSRQGKFTSKNRRRWQISWCLLVLLIH